MLHAGGKFEHGSYKTAGGLHGVGASVVNALSTELRASVKRDGVAVGDGVQARQADRRRSRRQAPARGTGTTVYFHPDPTIFPKVEFDAATIRERLEVVSYIHKGVRVTFENEADEDEGGLPARGRAVRLPEEDRGGALGEAGARRRRSCWRARASPGSISCCSGRKRPTSTSAATSTASRPAPAARTRTACAPASARRFATTSTRTTSSPKGVTLVAEDIREGLTGVLSVFIQEPQFQGQTKDRLNNPELTSAIDSAVRPALEHWLNHNRSVAEAIVGRVILAARAREASRAAQAEVTRKTATSGRLNLPGKLSDCTGAGRDDSELFVVEGDSAGGSAKQGRDRGRQAILPLRGKVMNTEGMTLAKVLENKELADLVTALGCGMGKNFDLGRLRYGKVIILADADSDGHHIATLLLTFLYRHLPQLISAGKVFLAQPPLYRIDVGKETYWALDDAIATGC